MCEQPSKLIQFISEIALAFFFNVWYFYLFSPKYWITAMPFLKVNFYWSIVAIQCYVSFHCQQSEAAIRIHEVVLVTKSCPTLCDPLDCICQAPLSMGFPRQEYWNGLPFPLPGDLPTQEPTSPALAGRFLTTEPLSKPPYAYVYLLFFRVLLFLI